MSPDEWLEEFRQAVSLPEKQINLAKAALIIATDEYPDLDIGRYLAWLDQAAEQVRPRLEPDQTPEAKIGHLNAYLFEGLHFRGNTAFYYDPRNSYLNDVIDRRVGLPITLSLLYVEIGRRVGLPLYGVGLPGHFIVKWHDSDREIFIDPFNGGRLVDEEHLVRLVEQTYQARVHLHREWLEAASPRFILTRILNNLKGIFMQNENLERAFQVVEKLLVLHPLAEEHLREAGLMAYRLGSYRYAAQLLEEYLLQHPETPEAGRMRVYLRTVWVALERLN